PRGGVGAPPAVGDLPFDGEPANTGSYRGRPLVLNFFAEWCAPCVAEMPDFETVHQEVGDEVAFLGLSLLEPEENAQGLIARTGITYDVGRDADGSAYEHFAGLAMPTTVFIDAAGTAREVHSGPLTAAELAYALPAAMVAAVHACGFDLRPAHHSYFPGLEGSEEGSTTSLGRARAVAGVVTAGFDLVFGLIGLVMTHLGITFVR